MAEFDPVLRPARRAGLEALHAAGLLSAPARREAIRCIRPPHRWWTWADRTLLLLGAALLLAGVVFFFAWNWAAMGAALKFGLIGAGLVACLVAAGLVGLDHLVGQTLLLAASVLVGVFLAVHGQVYQTGADACELFLAWAVLILGWTALARFAPLWLLWLVVLNTAVFLYWNQVVAVESCRFQHAPWVILALVHAAALAGIEAGRRAGRSWLAAPWLRWLLVTGVLAWLVIPVAVVTLAPEPTDPWGGVAVLLWLAAMSAAGWFYRFRAPDLPALTLFAASNCVVLLTLIGRCLAEAFEDAVFLLLLALAVLGIVGLALLWLRHTHRALAGGSDDR
ncbi:MAG: DUF2157 domain-containing protein [Planctomycetes bacterium]|nr:DUF2157 domain-containing protein [Planctomycetota bacterium]